MAIIAQSADGKLHEFPDGTDRSVVDRAMKQYASGAQPQPVPQAALTQEPQTSQALGVLEGIQRPIANLDRAIGGGLKRIGIDTGSDERYARYQQEYGQGAGPTLKGTALEGKRPGMAGQMAGNMGATLPTLFAGPVVGGAAYGALTTNADDLQGAAIDTALSAAGGKAGELAVRGMSRIAAPVIDAASREMLKRGVPLSLGQTMGGMARNIEDKATSIPIVGQFIKGAQDRATKGFNRAAFDDVLKPVGEKLPMDVSIGRNALEYTGDRLGGRYNTILEKATGKSDDQFVADLLQAVDDAKGKLPEQQFNRFKAIVETQISGKAGGQPARGAEFDGRTLQGINEELGRLSSGYKGDASFDNRELGSALGGVHKAFRDMVARSNPELAPQLRATDAAYAKFKRVQAAASGVGARDGVFSAPQLQSAVRAKDRSKDKGAFGKGRALMQDFSDAAVNVLPSTVPDSGTAGRVAIQALGGLGLYGGYDQGYIGPGTAGLLALGAGAYSRPGQALLRGAVAGAPQTRGLLADHLRRYGTKPGAALGAASLPALME